MTEIQNNTTRPVVDLDQVEGTNFENFNKTINQVAALNVQASGHRVIFKTDLERNALMETYLEAFPEDHRQYHSCTCCKRFLRAGGDYVTVDENGKLIALFWNEELVSDYFKPVVKALRERVEGARIEHPIYNDIKHLQHVGTETTGGFHHFHTSAAPGEALQFIKAPPSMAKAVSSQQLDAKEDYKFLARTINDFKDDTLETALKLFEVDVDLKHYPKHQGTLKWLIELRNTIQQSPRDRRPALLWLQVVTQSPGRVRYRSTTTGEYLELLEAGETAEAKRMFLKMVDSRDYMRPKAAPSQSNVKQAEQIVETLGLRPALARRFLRFDEVPVEAKTWVPTHAVAEETGSVFGHLKTKETVKKVMPSMIEGGKISWARFEDTVLPKAHCVKVLIDHTRRAFGSFSTAVNPDAPQLLRWDRPDARNTVGSFIMHESRTIAGTHPFQWGLAAGQMVAVKAITRVPQAWNNPEIEQNRSVLILDGGKAPKTIGLAIFPEDLRKELYAVRATIEAFSNAGDLGNYDESLTVLTVDRVQQHVNLTVEVNDGKFITRYLIDRGE